MSDAVLDTAVKENSFPIGVYVFVGQIINQFQIEIYLCYRESEMSDREHDRE